jgi:hypothetical protein
VTIRRGRDWILDLLTTCTHHSKLHVITALPLISTPYKSPENPLSFLQPVLDSRSLATASNSGDSSASRSQVIPSSIHVRNCPPAILSNELDRHLFSASPPGHNCTQHSTNSQLSSTADSQMIISWLGILVIWHRGEPNRKHRFVTIPSLLLAYSFTEPSPILAPLFRLSGVMS